MEGGDLQKGLLQLMKSNLETYFQTQQMLQEQGEKMLDMLITQSDSIQAEGKNLLKKWLVNAKKASAEYRKVMEESLKKSEEFFGQGP